AQMAAQAQAAELWLTHYSPSMIYRQAEEAMNGVRAIFENAVMGRDGMSKDLLFEDEDTQE
ncbi:MAG: ribonuclease Z, partial [Lachnospiraceae bacterium]|nr:ribonuclease Z [Lachnospiraceae bacterium]